MTPDLPTRRNFLRQATTAVVLASLPPAAIARSTRPAKQDATRRLHTGWTFRRGPLTLQQARADGSPWQPVTVPHCTNADDACDPDRPYFQGQSWYRLRLKIDNPYPQGHTLLHFQGAGQTTSVWCDGMPVGTHVGGYDEFVIDLTASAAHHANLDLLVCCDSTPEPARSPSNLSDFCLYGGLYRQVQRVYLPAVALASLTVRQSTAAHGPATLQLQGTLYGTLASGTTVPVDVEVFEPGGQRIFKSSHRLAAWQGPGPLATVEVADPVRWSPDSPGLYRCRVTVGHDCTVEERVGIRHVNFEEHGLFHLNGQSLFLKGTQRHQDCAEAAGAQSDESVRKEMALIKEMGANFIRLGHYQQDRLVLDLCDELGLLVWEEVPWCRAGVGTAEWQTNTRAQLERMIEQHRNHPSIVFWGLGNEDDWPAEQPSVNQAAIRSFMAELNQLAHRLDPDRLTSYRRCEFARDIPDVYSPSIWAGWYNGTYREYEQAINAERPRQKRLLHIEWGADSHAGRHAEDPYAGLGRVATGTGAQERDGDFLRSGGAVRVSRDGDWSETYACDLFDWYLKTQQTMSWLAGSAQWVFKDFASPLRADSPIPYVNQKGVLGRDLKPKESYAVFQSYWSSKPMIHIYGHTWPRRWGAKGERRTVKIYSSCPQAELFLNGVSLGVRQRDAQNFPAANLRWEVIFLPGHNALRAVGSHGSTQVEDSITLDYQTEPWSTPAGLRLRCLAGQAIEAEVVDASGIRCLDARTMLRFRSSGAVTLAGNQGTVSGSRVLEASNGLVTIRLLRHGKGVVTVSSSGLPEVSITV